LEFRGFCFDDVPGEVEHLLRDLDVLDIVEILGLVAYLVWIAQQHAGRPLPRASSAMMCSRLVNTTRAMATLSMVRMVSRMTA